MSFNKIFLIGNLGRDPELRYTPQGTAVCNFSVAVNERWQDSGGNQQERTTWFRVTVWGKRAEIANQYLKKGSQVFVEGRLSVREYNDKSGAVRTSLDVNASDFQLLDRKVTDVPYETISEPGPTEPIPSPIPSDDDVPF
ncbi:MAG: single-stranded DNA-binding protein [Acidobacteriota bacterium]|nr:single-stranded DNA-binding protein [Blastocatellia bacterium]MDW8240392.1 single-stranded DNA-binding protein [Acidobacteriota bacterium]